MLGRLWIDWSRWQGCWGDSEDILWHIEKIEVSEDEVSNYYDISTGVTVRDDKLLSKIPS